MSTGPEDRVLQLLRDMRTEMATRADIAELRAASVFPVGRGLEQAVSGDGSRQVSTALDHARD